MKRLFAAFLAVLIAATPVYAQIPIPVPQTVSPPFVPNGLDETGTFTARSIYQSDIQSPLPSSTVTANVDLEPGQLYFPLDNPSGFFEGLGVQFTSVNDPSNYAVCIITAINASGNTTCNTTVVQGGGIIDNNWIAQVVGGSTLEGVPVWAGLAVDGNDSVTIPSARGAVINITLEAGKTFRQNSTVYVWAPQDQINSWYEAIVLSYNTTTGVTSLFVTETSNSGSTWSLYYVSLITVQGPNGYLVGYSSSNLTPTAGNSFTWVTQAGQFFPVDGQVIVNDLNTAGNYYVGKVKAYSGTSLIITIAGNGAYGTGTASSSWSIYLTTGPTTRISQFQMNGLQISQTVSFGGASLLGAVAINSGSIRDTTDTVDLIYSGGTVDLTGSTPIQVGQSGTATSAGTAVTGTGTTFTTSFSITATLNDYTNQVTATNSSNITSYPSIINTGVGLGTSASTLAIADDTHLTSGSNLGAAGSAVNRGGHLTIDITSSIAYGIVLARNDSNGNTEIDVTSFTPSGLPDLPSGRTYYRIIGAIVAVYNGTNFSMAIYQPLATQFATQLIPKAIWSGTITPTAVTGSISSVNAGTEVITWSTNHGLTTGQCVRGIGTVPTGFTVGQMFYVNALSATTFALYTTLANAIADTSRVNLTTTTTGATMVTLVYSNTFNVGFSTVAPIAGAPGSTTMHFDFNLTNALASTTGVVNILTSNLVDSAAGTGQFWQAGPGSFTFSSTTLVSLSVNYRSIASNLNQGTWVQQALTSWTVYVQIWG
jgi:hypothetical protein